MKNLKLFNHSDLVWKTELSKSNCYSYLNDNDWAKYLEVSGWETCRWTFEDNNYTFFLQGFLKIFPFNIRLLWFPDFNLYSNFENRIEVKKIISLLGHGYYYVRIRCHKIYNSKDLKDLKSELFRPKFPLGSGYTMYLDLTSDRKLLKKNLTKNWRKNLKRSNRIDYNIVDFKNPKIVYDLYNKMAKEKSLNQLFSLRQISTIISQYQKNLILIGAKTADGKIHALRGAIIYKHTAIDIFAASDHFAKKNYLSYALCWELILRCSSKGLKRYDFNGVDYEKNIGVYNFKKGTGAKLVKQLGEFEWSNSIILRTLINYITYFKLN